MERWFVALCGICSRWLFSVASNSLSRLMVPTPSLPFPPLPSPPLLSSPQSPSPPLFSSTPSFSPPLLLLVFHPIPSSSLLPLSRRLLEHEAETSFSALALTPALYVCVYVGFFFYWLNLVGVLVVSAAFLTPRWENEAGMNTNRGWVIEKRHW